MAKKKKINSEKILALEVYNDIFNRQPDFAEKVEFVIKVYKEKFGSKWNYDLTYCPITALELALDEEETSYFRGLKGRYASLLAGMAAWNLSKVIYRFDSAFFKELKETEGISQVPTDVLMHLPYKCLCLQVGDESRLVFIDYNYNASEYTLCIEKIAPNNKDKDGTFYFLLLTSSKLQKCIADTLKLTAERLKKFNFSQYEKPLEEFNSNREIFESTIQMILFIQSQNSDIVENEKNAEARRKYNQNRIGAKRIPKVLDSGYRIGAEIRRVKEINVYKEDPESAENTASNVKAVPTSAGSKKTPHVRRAHWHHYWIGSEKAGNRKLVIRWLPPMAIGSRSEGLAAVVRDVRKD